jgi:hypothetical protein
MPASKRLTPALIQDIAAYIRAGGFPHVAAEAAGIPQHVFARWLKLANKKGSMYRGYRALRSAVRQAQAEARLAAEIAAFNEKPLDWLRSGPGKPTADRAGWTGPARATHEDSRPADPLLNETIQEMLRRVLDCLQDFPEARTHVAKFFDQAGTPAADNGTS